jgi:hypothetical protein
MVHHIQTTPLSGAEVPLNQKTLQNLPVENPPWMNTLVPKQKDH